MGLTLWLLQRFTALCMAFFAGVMYTYFSSVVISYETFVTFFQCPWRATLYVFTVLMISLHTMIGVWAIAGDYLKCRCVRYTVLSGYGSLLVLANIVAILSVGRLL